MDAQADNLGLPTNAHVVSGPCLRASASRWLHDKAAPEQGESCRSDTLLHKAGLLRVTGPICPSQSPSSEKARGRLAYRGRDEL